jgi:hypothetical protein
LNIGLRNSLLARHLREIVQGIIIKSNCELSELLRVNLRPRLSLSELG